MKPKKKTILRSPNNFRLRKMFIAFMRKHKLLRKMFKLQLLNSHGALQLCHVEQDQSRAVQVLNKIDLQPKINVHEKDDKNSTEKMPKQNEQLKKESEIVESTEVEKEEDKNELKEIEPETENQEIEIESEELVMETNQSKKEQTKILSKVDKNAKRKMGLNKRNTKAKEKPRKNLQSRSKPSKTEENCDVKQETNDPVEKTELSDTCFEELIEDFHRKSSTKIEKRQKTMNLDPRKSIYDETMFESPVNKSYKRKNRTENFKQNIPKQNEQKKESEVVESHEVEKEECKSELMEIDSEKISPKVSIYDETTFADPLTPSSRRIKSRRNKTELGSESAEDKGGEDKIDKLETTIRHNERPRRSLARNQSFLTDDSVRKQLEKFVASSKGSCTLKY